MATDASNLQFGQSQADYMAAFYELDDIRRRRSLVLDALDAEHGEHMLDVGCGPGFYLQDLADVVGPDGGVTGIDISRHMLDAARRRVGGAANVTLLLGAAGEPELPEGRFDGAISVQVLEYVPDVPTVLEWIWSALRPGGRIVLWDIDWSTVSWASSDEWRMEQVLRAWDEHLVHRSLPQRLPVLLRDAGYVDVRAAAHAFVNTGDGAGGYGSGLVRFIEDYLEGRDEVDRGDLAAWASEQRHRQQQGEFFFSITQFCFIGRKPG